MPRRCSQHNIRNHHIQHQDDEAGDHNSLRAGLAEFQGAALDAVAVEGGHGGHDESEDAGLGERIDHVINTETVGETVDEVVGGDAVGDPYGQEAAEEGESDTENAEDGVHDNRCQHFRQYQMRGGIDTHNLQCINHRFPP